MDFLKKYLSREFIIAVALIIIATVAMFEVLTGENFGTVFVTWAGTVGGFAAIYTTGKTVQKVKANGNNK